MKPAQVNKLYSKLIPYEQAALCFEAAARQDEAEINDIVDSIEKHSYRCLHTDKAMDFLNSVAGVLSFGLPFGLPDTPG